MATRNAVVSYPSKGVVKVQWTGLLNTDVGDAQDLSRYPDITVQASGIFGVGGTVSLQGTNDGSNFNILNDSRGEGNAMTFTAADQRQLSEGAVAGLRPNVTAGDGSTSLTITLIGTTPR